MPEILCITSKIGNEMDPHVEMVQNQLGEEIRISVFDPYNYPMSPISYELNSNGHFEMDFDESTEKYYQPNDAHLV